MKAKHTPGPWYVSRHPSLSENGDSVLCEADGSIICEGLNWSACAQANARLIAAAPDLLEALEAILPYAQSYCDEGPDGYGWKSEPLAAKILQAQAAIAKAKGETT